MAQVHASAEGIYTFVPQDVRVVAIPYGPCQVIVSGESVTWTVDGIKRAANEATIECLLSWSTPEPALAWANDVGNPACKNATPITVTKDICGHLGVEISAPLPLPAVSRPGYIVIDDSTDWESEDWDDEDEAP